jgi:hypothetical protein
LFFLRFLQQHQHHQQQSSLSPVVLQHLKSSSTKCSGLWCE